jgi:hypothetical protein
MQAHLLQQLKTFVAHATACLASRGVSIRMPLSSSVHSSSLTLSLSNSTAIGVSGVHLPQMQAVAEADERGLAAALGRLGGNTGRRDDSEGYSTLAATALSRAAPAGAGAQQSFVAGGGGWEDEDDVAETPQPGGADRAGDNEDADAEAAVAEAEAAAATAAAAAAAAAEAARAKAEAARAKADARRRAQADQGSSPGGPKIAQMATSPKLAPNLPPSGASPVGTTDTSAPTTAVSVQPASGSSIPLGDVSSGLAKSEGSPSPGAVPANASPGVPATLLTHGTPATPDNLPAITPVAAGAKASQTVAAISDGLSANKDAIRLKASMPASTISTLETLHGGSLVPPVASPTMLLHSDHAPARSPAVAHQQESAIATLPPADKLALAAANATSAAVAAGVAQRATAAAAAEAAAAPLQEARMSAVAAATAAVAAVAAAHADGAQHVVSGPIIVGTGFDDGAADDEENAVNRLPQPTILCADGSIIPAGQVLSFECVTSLTCFQSWVVYCMWSKCSVEKC